MKPSAPHTSDQREKLEQLAASVVPLFPPGCTCSSYGRGLTITRVNSHECPIHGEQRLSFAEYAEAVADDDASDLAAIVLPRDLSDAESAPLLALWFALTRPKP